METFSPAIIDTRLGFTAEDEPDGLPESPLDLLMRQVVDGFFLLTDGQGAVSKWGEPAELLFGLEASEALGRPLFGHLVADPCPPPGEAWRGFLERGEAPDAPARVQLTGVNARAGEHFDIELVFVPVKLDEGFDFSLFLEDLGFELPSNLMLARMRQQHPVVVRAFGEALGAPQPWEQQRTAGTLVVLRPTVPTPWVQHELATREAARAAADAELEGQLTELDPGVQGESIYELEDAAAVVARMLDAFRRIEGLEHIAEELPAELEATRREADVVRAQAEAAQREAQQARAGLEELSSGLRENSSAPDERQELLTRVDRLENDRNELARRLQELRAEQAQPPELAERLQRLEQEVDRAAGQQPAAVAPEQLEGLRARTDERFSALDQRTDERFSALDGRVAGLAGGASGLEHGLAATRERLDGLGGDVGRVDADFQAALADARHELSTLRDDAERLRSESGALRDTVAEAGAAAEAAAQERVSDLRSELEGLRELVGQYRQGFDEARQAAVLARRDAEIARRAVESGAEAQAADGRRLDAIVGQLFGAAAANAGTSRPAAGTARPLAPASTRKDKPQPAGRAARPGFDDVSSPLALLGLDGRFRQLNPAFAKLVGYPEDEFAKAQWPSVHDRGVLAEQEQQLLRLAAGELDSVRVQSSYMHGQGLMVLVSGTLSLVRDAGGRPDHLILSAEDR